MPVHQNELQEQKDYSHTAKFFFYKRRIDLQADHEEVIKGNSIYAILDRTFTSEFSKNPLTSTLYVEENFCMFMQFWKKAKIELTFLTAPKDCMEVSKFLLTFIHLEWEFYLN